MDQLHFRVTLEFFIPVLFCCLLLYFFYLKRLREAKLGLQPAIGYSLFATIPNKKGKEKWIQLPETLLWLTIAFFLTALLDPQLVYNKTDTKQTGALLATEGIALYLVLDQSGSMTEKVPSGEGHTREVSKLDLVRNVTRKFIQGDPNLNLAGRSNDLIGLIYFARGSHVEAPLTLDHDTILQKLEHYERVSDKTEDGTAIGYAIYKAAHLISATKHYTQELIQKGEPAYTIKNSAIILLTDGLQDPNPLDKGKQLRNIDIPDAAAYAKSQNIHLYVINVEPKLATDEFAPYRHIMQRASEATGGKFYMIDSSHNLEEIYKQIDALEKSSIPFQEGIPPYLYPYIKFSPYLIAAGALCLLCSIFCNAFWLRRVP